MPSVSPRQVPDGPVRRLFDELRRLHRSAGEPSTRTLAKAVAHGHATVHTALRGPRVPRWGLLELLVEELNGDVEYFKQLWIAARDFEDPHDRHLPPVGTGAQAEPRNEPVGKTSHAAHPPAIGAVTATMDRLRATLDRLQIGYRQDDAGDLIARWERHAVLVALEGPSSEILVIRTRPNVIVPAVREAEARAAVNEWNHSRRFMKAYVGDAGDDGQVSIFAEMQTPLLAGVHDDLLLELIDCAIVVSQGFVDWLHTDAALY